MSASGTGLWLLVWKAHDALREHAHRHIRSLGIGLSDFAVLEMVLHKGPTPVNAIGPIGQKVGLTSGSITAAVDRLERKGLVARRPQPDDRRARVVHLTAAGRKLIGRAFAGHAAAMETATSGLTAAGKAQTAALLQKLGLRAQALLEGPDAPAIAKTPFRRS
jgi:MarR family 2-MHQ and catechol resistance regulon transcriptional repressor